MSLVPYSDDDDDSIHGSSEGGSTSSEAPSGAQPPGISRAASHQYAVHTAQQQGPPLVRRFAHVEGNYPTVVYIPVRLSDQQRDVLQKVFDKLREHLPTVQLAVWQPSVSGPSTVSAGSLTVPHDHHISISRTVPIRFPQIDVLVASLRHELRRTSRLAVGFGQLDTLVNENATRMFVSLMVKEAFPQVCSIIKAVNRALAPLGLPTFHQDPRPHVSIAWDSADLQQQAVDAVQPLNQLLCEEETQISSIQVDKVCCQIGKKCYTVWQDG